MADTPMLECPNCGAETNKLIGSDELKKVVCPSCHPGTTSTRSARDYELNWKNSKGVTNGKAWEIDNRVIAKDGQVINKITGKSAQR